MANAFIGRSRELDVLDELYDSEDPELFVLYGRRRVGKTELLQQFCEGRRAVYFLAAQVREKDNLKGFRDALREGLGDPILDGIEFPDWPSAFGFAAERSSDERLVIVLDEFPYLCESTKGLASLLQQFWDQRGKRSKLMFVLCGSQVSFMEKEVLSEKSPLFGRRTGQRRLEPLAPTEALAFHPTWSLEQRVLAYGILGGMPAYLRRFNQKRDIEENLLREVLRPEGYLFDEVAFLLKTELNNPATYNSILRAVAGGASRVGDIALTVGVDSTTANKYLHVLRELGLVERSIPLTDPNPLRSRRGVYRVADRFVSFHFRHVQPHLSLIEAGRGPRVLEQFVKPDFARLLDDARVDFFTDFLRREAACDIGLEVLEVGRHSGSFVRAIGRLEDGSALAAVAKPDPALPTPTSTLEGELDELRKVFAGKLTVTHFELTDNDAEPVRMRVEGKATR
ncbi:MAG: AAA+ ATPase superfamily predicted ATPase [Bacteroidia bacterium]|jgi:AAA+ ATPase superfamily predicted ATPase